MTCPIHVQKAIERIQLDIYTITDEKLVNSWVEWHAQQVQDYNRLSPAQMNDTEKEEWENPVKRLRNSVDELQHCIAK